jgi:hypothetical protein
MNSSAATVKAANGSGCTNTYQRSSDSTGGNGYL